MDKIFTIKEFLAKINQALNVRTLYVNGCFGAPLNYKSNLTRYTTNNTYNKNHAETIKKAAAKAAADGVPIFGGDCHCTYKGFAWGWDAKADEIYGGAQYQSNGLPDCTITTERTKYCEGFSTDFSNIVPGEMVFMEGDGHVGVYVGDGMVAENTPKWDNCFQLSECWNVQKKSSKGRYWWGHAKLLWVDYSEPTPPTPPEPPVPEKKKITCPCCGNLIWNDGTVIEDEFEIYTVQSRDTLWGIAKKFYGKGSLYTVIFNDNRDVIKDPNIICTGWKLKIRK